MFMLTRTWKREEAAALIGTTPRRLAGWAERGLLEAMVTEGRGHGARRHYNIVNLIEGVVLLAMDDAGLADTVRRGTLAVVRHQLEEGRIVEQLLAGRIETGITLFAMTGAKDGSAFAVVGTVSEWGKWAEEAVATGVPVTAIPLERRLTDLLTRLREEETAA
jgi:hypothetical protein